MNVSQSTQVPVEHTDFHACFLFSILECYLAGERFNVNILSFKTLEHCLQTVFSSAICQPGSWYYCCGSHWLFFKVFMFSNQIDRNAVLTRNITSEFVAVEQGYEALLCIQLRKFWWKKEMCCHRTPVSEIYSQYMSKWIYSIFVSLFCLPDRFIKISEESLNVNSRSIPFSV